MEYLSIKQHWLAKSVKYFRGFIILLSTLGLLSSLISEELFRDLKIDKVLIDLLPVFFLSLFIHNGIITIIVAFLIRKIMFDKEYIYIMSSKNEVFRQIPYNTINKVHRVWFVNAYYLQTDDGKRFYLVPSIKFEKMISFDIAEYEIIELLRERINKSKSVV